MNITYHGCKILYRKSIGNIFKVKSKCKEPTYKKKDLLHWKVTSYKCSKKPTIMGYVKETQKFIEKAPNGQSWYNMNKKTRHY
jgi:hypothetical protein